MKRSGEFPVTVRYWEITFAKNLKSVIEEIDEINLAIHAINALIGFTRNNKKIYDFSYRGNKLRLEVVTTEKALKRIANDHVYSFNLSLLP